METINATNAVAQGQKKEEPPVSNYRLTVREHADFDAVQETSIITSKNLGDAINGIFETGFADYRGCNLVPVFINNVGNVLIPYLFFQIFPKEQYTNNVPFAFKPIISSNKTVIENIQRITSPLSPLNNTVEMTADAMSALEEFVPHDKNKKIEWKSMWSVQNVDGDTIVQLQGLNIINILKKLYGEYDHEKSRYSYAINPVKPVTENSMMPGLGRPQNHVLEIMRVKEGSLARATESVGMIMSSNSRIPMMRANTVDPSKFGVRLNGQY